MFIPDPVSWILLIPDPDLGSRIQKKRQSHKIHIIEKIFFWKCWRKIFWPIFKELYILLTKLSLSYQRNMGWGSGIRKKPIPDPGVKKAPDPGSGSRVWWLKIEKKFTTRNLIYIFWIKNAIYLSLGLHKGRPSYRRSLQPSKVNIQHFKRWKFCSFFNFFFVIFPLLDPDPDPQFVCGSGSGSNSSN
jgi:hypothetical protein